VRLLPSFNEPAVAAVVIATVSSIVFSTRLPLFDAAQLFHPHRFMSESLNPSFQASLLQCLGYLVMLKGVRGVVTVSQLSGEFLEFQRQIRVRKLHLDLHAEENTPVFLWLWLRSLNLVVPSWYHVATILLLMQPSSATIERLFALLKAHTNGTQNQEKEATQETRALLLYNRFHVV